MVIYYFVCTWEVYAHECSKKNRYLSLSNLDNELKVKLRAKKIR
jgi:hypothetical protein